VSDTSLVHGSFCLDTLWALDVASAVGTSHGL